MTLPILETLRGKKSSHTPVWFMRQAGRYLPEYREVRKSFPQFLEFCYTPEAACKVTLQPLARFDFDAAILFSDILVIPDGLGQKVWFEQGEGPRLEPIQTLSDIDQLSIDRVQEHLQPVMQAIRLIRKELPKEKALIGFSGSPWTLACYMLEGKGSKEFETARQFAYRHREAMAQLIETLTQAIIRYARDQIENGIAIFQLFDSWSGVLPESEFEEWVIAPTQKITRALKETHPHIPIIGFARGAGMKLHRYAAQTSVDAVGVDTSMSMAEVIAHHAGGKTVQGNLDPMALAGDTSSAIAQTKRILEATRQTPHIFNLGHGIIPSTPIENVEAVIQTVRDFRP